MPRVSFVLIAFRQEAYVEAAARAALAQDYPNLEIVLSDDGSPDGTYAVMERLAADYAGPHRLILNRTGGGKGTLAHVLDATARSSGELIVIGAGDDISYPQRVSRLVAEWQRTGAQAVFSAFHRIDDSGRKLSEEAVLAREDYDPAPFFTPHRARQIAGATAAYDRRLLDAIRLPEEPIFAEDYFLSLVLGWRSGTAARIDDPLIAYRIHGGAMTSAGEDLLGVEAFEQTSARSAAMTRDALRAFERMVRQQEGIETAYGHPAKVRLDRIKREIEYLDYRARWLDLSFAGRAAASLRLQGRDQWRWALPRLFGPRLLAIFKQP
nr:glycosyltransferase [Sphingomonas arenae]